MKQVETRPWATHYRGELAIHSAGRQMSEEAFDLLADYPLKRAIHYGSVLAVCTLVGCVRIPRENKRGDVQLLVRGVPFIVPEQELALGDWTPGRFAWLLSGVKPLRKPILVRGAQGLWEWSGR